MTIVLLFIAAIIIVAALRNTQSVLASALSTDVPAYITWAAAILAVGSLGYIPALKGPSKALLALVLLVIILTNYQNILNGFTSVAQGAPATAAPNSPDQNVESAAAAVGAAWSAGVGDPLTNLINGIYQPVAGALTPHVGQTGTVPAGTSQSSGAAPAASGVYVDNTSTF